MIQALMNMLQTLICICKFTVVPTHSLPNVLNAYGEYAHQENHIEISPTISFTGEHSFIITNSTKWTYQYVRATLNNFKYKIEGENLCEKNYFSRSSF